MDLLNVAGETPQMVSANFSLSIAVHIADIAVH